MAAHPVVVVGDGFIEIPADLKNDPRFRKGAKLELVPVAEFSLDDANVREKGDWRRLRGIFKDATIHLNEELRKDRLSELATDERMLNGYGSGH